MHVIQFVALQAVGQAHGGVFADGIGGPDGVTDSVLGEVVPVIVRVIEVVAQGKVRVVDAGVGEGQHARGAPPGEETLQLEPVAPAEEIALHDGGGDAHVIIGRVADAAHDGAGVGFLDLDLEVHLVLIACGNQLRVHGGEVTQAVQAFAGAAQFGAFVHIAVAQAHFAQNDVVAGLGVAFHRETADEDLLLFVDQIAHVHLGTAVVGLHQLGVHFCEGVAVVGVVVRQALGVFLHDRQGEVFVGLLPIVHLHHLEHVVFAVDDVAGEFHVV